MSKNGTEDSKSSTLKLDLGLSTLLEDLERSQKESSEEIEPLAEVLKKSLQNSKESKKISLQEPGEPKLYENNYANIAQKESWTELSKFCENKLAESNDADLGAKLWWIISQFRSSAIPTTILAPSLDLAAKGIFKQESEYSAHQETCLDFLFDFIFDLQSKKEFELALSFLNLTAEYEQGSKVKTSELFLTLEKSYLSTDHSEDERNLTQDFKNLKEKLGISSPAAQSPQNVFNTTNQERIILSHKPRVQQKNSHSIIYIVLVAVCMLSVIFYSRSYIAQTYSTFFSFFTAKEKEEYFPSLHLKNHDVQSEAILPEIQRVAGLNKLDAVFYDLSKKMDDNNSNRTASISPASAPLAVSASRPVAATLPHAASLPNRSAEELESVARDTVNTKYPIERDPVIASRDNSTQEIPEIDFPPYRNRPSDRVSPPGKRANEPNYKVIARTRVMEEPSYWANTASDLYEGDRILVEVDLGKWLRIRAKNGEVGYILAQDALRLY